MAAIEGVLKVRIISEADFVKLEISINNFLQAQKLIASRVKSIQYSAYPIPLIAGEPCQALIMYF
jgi:hypothetical protein